MRVATWNVNGLRARLDYLRLWLRERQPDVVALQELKLTDEQFPHDALAEEGYAAAVHGQKAWNGVAVLARGDVEATCVGLPGQEELGARLLTAEAGGLRVTSVYVPNGKSVSHDDYARKLAWLDALLAHLEAEHDPSRPEVLCGDFNIVPSPLDTWDEEGLAGTIFHTDQERERFERLKRWGLADLFRRRHPDAREYSWWDYRAGAFPRGRGLRIDFVMGTPSVLEGTRDVVLDRDWRKKKDGLTASDHAPVFAELQ